MLTPTTANAEATNPSTPTGLQTRNELTRRRYATIALNAVTYAALCAVMARLCAASGWTPVDIALFVCFVFVAPWGVLGFWNAALGLWLVPLRRDTLAAGGPYAAAGGASTPLHPR